MRKHDFYGLPRSLQDRFIESSVGAAVPAPLAVQPEQDTSSRNWAVATLAATAVWGAYFFLGFGQLESPMALGGAPHLAGHILIAGVVAFCLLRSIAASWGTSRLPYGRGWYLFPSGVIHAVGHDLIEFDAQDVQSSEVVGNSVVVIFGSGSRFAFPASDAERAQAAHAAFEQARMKWSELPETSLLDRARLNPLADSGVPNPLAPTAPHIRPTLLRPTAFVVTTIALAVLLGFGIYTWRESLSERALYRAATARDTAEAYERYVAGGGDRTEVTELLLPRARLRKAVAQDTVEAIEEFQAKYPNLKIAGEVQNALRQALLAELQRASSNGGLEAIDSMSKRFADAELIAPEIAQARRQVFADALADFQKRAATSNAELVPFVQRLLTYAEKHGPKVLVRFEQDFPQEREKLDGLVRKSRKYYLGSKSLPTQYFLGEQARTREKLLGERIVDRLQHEFPKDVLRFELAELPERENVEVEPSEEFPTLIISHQARLSGGFVGGKPKSMYMGATLLMEAEFHIPDGVDRPLIYKRSAWLSPKFANRTETPTDISGVYEDMIGSAFDKFADRFLAQWLREE